jgi:CheY-like chemotaxis protein
MSHHDDPDPCRVLVVDDCPDTTTSMEVMLRLWGHEVWTAADGLSALTLLEHHTPDIVLLDLGLPGMDGFEVARRLRQCTPLREMLLVAVSGFSREEDRRKAIAAGCNFHLTKPVEPEALRRLLQCRAVPAGDL